MINDGGFRARRKANASLSDTGTSRRLRRYHVGVFVEKLQKYIDEF